MRRGINFLRFPYHLGVRTSLMLNTLKHLENIVLLSYALDNPEWQHFIPEDEKKKGTITTPIMRPTDRLVSRLNREFAKNLGLHTSSAKFLRNILGRVGLVRGSSYLSGYEEAFELTRDGKKYGRPSSNLAVVFSIENKIPVNQVFYDGYISPTGTIPLSRFCILKKLYELRGREVRRGHLGIDLDEDNKRVADDVSTLEAFGLVETTEFEVHKIGYDAFRWITQKPVEEVCNELNLPHTREIAGYFAKRRTSTIKACAKTLHIPATYIINVIENLKRKGFLLGIDPIPPGKRYRVEITANGINFYEKFNAPLIRILMDDNDTIRANSGYLPLDYMKQLISLQRTQ